MLSSLVATAAVGGAWSPIWVACGGLYLAGCFISGGAPAHSLDSLLVALVLLSLTTATIYLLSTWCLAPNHTPSLAPLVGMGTLLFLLGDISFLTFWVDLASAPLVGPSVTTSILNVDALNRLLSAASHLCGIVAIVLTLSVLSVELPLRWFIERVLGKGVRHDLVLEFRWMGSLLWLVYGWPLVEGHVQSEFPALIQHLTGAF